MSTRRTSAIIVSSVALLMGLGAVTPASAAARPPGPADQLTLWDDTYFSDTSQSRSGYDASFKNDGFNDKASSVVNKTGAFWLLFDDTSYEGRAVCVRPYSFVYDFASVGFGDKTSSVRKRTKNVSSCNDFPLVGTKNSEWS